ncbi:hypothetical protein SAMN05216596_11099 [Pseudomonas congelans]|uniref:NACHT domain-containing protein n=1 Tax=Pseudomonas congelans TaxID=200452 RepID=A0A0P9PGW7_9PSED|nr:hypothetical protein [Pseudomonas congelans]KPW84055.1 Uncharacterized protein ALO92_01453 [Pseudomonas congelans]SDP82409.1 hypothetical protein SAMN05216596_11099 [Pseudomonas congelans]
MNIAQTIEDIKLFCDPFTEIAQKPVAGKKRIILIRNGRELTFDIDVETGRISAKHKKAEYKDVKTLIASVEFSDIKRFAETQKRFFSQTKEKPLIESEISYSGNDILAKDLDENIKITEGKVTLVLLDGPAGVGKTFQITELAKAQCKKFLSDNISPPVLIISSSGRRLSNFKDVLAATTQEMGASFTGAHVPMLVRHGLLIAAIDGFDELVDADGYEDSWRALKDFIEDVGNSGKVILAARDTFLDEQELISRISTENEEAIDLKLAHIKLATIETAIQYLSSSKWKPTDLSREITADIFSNNSYALRPFFLSVLRDAGGWSNVNSEGFRSFLVNNLIDRESKMLSKTFGTLNGEDVASSLNTLFEEVSLEMASRENSLIEIDHLAFLTDYCFSELLDDNSRRKLTHKAGSISLLETSDIKDKRKFPHAEVQYYFLGNALLAQLARKTIPSVLRRTILSAEHLEVFAEVFTQAEQTAKKAMDYLYATINGDSSNDGLASNGGAMVLLGFAMGLTERIDYLVVNDATFAGGSPVGTLQDVTVSRLDVCGSDVSKVNFDKVKIGTFVANEFTLFGNSVPSIDALEIRGEAPRIERDPAEIDTFIRNHFADADKGKLREHPAVCLLEKVARRSVRYCYLRDGDDDEGSFMLRDEHWPQVKSVLLAHGRMEVKKGKPMHGRPAALMRIKRPIELIDYDSPETLGIIEQLIRETM